MPESKMTIKIGTYFGESFGYTDDELLLTPEKMVYTRKSGIETVELPPKVKDFPMPERDWKAVSKQVDWSVLNSLPDRVGRPDEYDQGGEFLEVVEGAEKKRIDWEPGAPPPELAELMEKLHAMRREAARKFPDR